MTSKFSLWALLLTATLAFTSSCEKDNDAPEQLRINANSDSVCLIINQGNYSESNGNFSLYSTTTDSMNNSVFEAANNRGLASMLVDALVIDSIGITTCNLSDKIEFFNARTFTSLCAPIEDVVNPRNIATYGNKAYVSCWGTPDDMTALVWTYSNSYIVEIDLTTLHKIRTISCGNEAEGLYVKNGQLFVAVADGVEVYSLPGVTFTKKITTTFATTARRIDEDKNGNLWVSFNDFSFGVPGFAVINPTTHNVEQEVKLSKLETYGKFALNKEKSQILYTFNNYWYMEPSAVYTINVDTYDVSQNAIITGTSLAAIGTNIWNGDIYVGSEDFTANSTVYIYSANGSLKNSIMVGVSPQKFLFY